MTITVGEPVPAVTLKHLADDGMQDISTDTLFSGKKVVMFGVPGAFTPSCSEKHLPGYVGHADAFKAKGVDQVVCMAVNDPFVMKAWGKEHGVDNKVFMLPDGNAALTKQMGLELDASGVGLGTRSKRFAMVVDHGVVKTLAVEEDPTQVDRSSAEAILATL